MNYPYILVLHEKWGDAFFLMNESEDVLKFALETLESRFAGGYYYEPEKIPNSFDEYFKVVHKMGLIEAQELADNYGDSVRLGNRTAQREIDSMQASYNEMLHEIEQYHLIKSTVENKNGKAAWRILQERSSCGYQYEGFSRERIENKPLDN